MAPPEGSIFDPAKKWDEEKEMIAKAAQSEVEANAKVVKKKGGGGKKGGAKKISSKDAIKESNVAQQDVEYMN